MEGCWIKNKMIPEVYNGKMLIVDEDYDENEEDE